MKTILLTGDVKFFDECYDKRHDIHNVSLYVKELLNIDSCVFDKPENTVHPVELNLMLLKLS